ncbi:hypothetical protein AMECASPLE_022948 [Ameca splendens]|uniref:Uncharacterized protein n=1 Tax=Ameca splendens TaxID=208324 RepID=A0ABV0XGZ2_9TELE
MKADGKLFTNTALLDTTRMILLLFFLITGACTVTPKMIYVKVGELVTLRCRESEQDGTLMLWKKETDQKMHLYSNMSSSEQQKLGLVVYQNSLVILSASVNHQGNYSCGPLSNTSSQMFYRLIVCSNESKQCNIRKRYDHTCYRNKACKLYCPEGEFLPAGVPGITKNKLKWHKENGEPSEPYFPSVELEASGVYICTRSYLYSGGIYNISLTSVLDVQTGERRSNLGIYSPKNGQAFEVELGTTMRIECKAIIDSCTDDLFWIHGTDFLDSGDYYTDSCNESGVMPQRRTTLIFKEISQANLSTNFTCKLDKSTPTSTSIVNIILFKKAQPSRRMVTICTVCIVVLTVVTVVIYVKFKIDVTLFVRDKVGFKLCQSNTSDGKSFDAFLMCYKSYTDGGLSEADRKCLATTLEDQFGYSLCLYDRDVLPGQAIAEAVLACIEQSRAVVLVPSFPDPKTGSGVLSAIHASLVEQKTRLIFINTEQTEASRSGSFPEALQLLSKAGKSVTWKGGPPSSCFWKQLRYHLPAPQQTPKMQLLPQGC